MASNQTNNPYVQPSNQTVISNITSAATSAINNITKNAVGADGSAGGVASNISAALTFSGMSIGSTSDVMAISLDQLISGSSGIYTKGSPERVTTDALQNRNKSAETTSNPETKVPNSQADTANSPILYFPQELAQGSIPYHMVLEFAAYTRLDPLGNTTLNPKVKIFLPLPNGDGLVDNTEISWSAKELGAYGNILDNIDRQGKAALSTGNLSDAAIYAGLSLIKNSVPELADTAQTAAGIAPNPALAQTFNGITFRNFGFDWMFSPKNVKESANLKEIINIIKSLSLPTFSGEASTAFFNYPYIVKPQIFPADTAASMTDYKWCVIKSVNVHYSPQDSSPTFYTGTHAPVFIGLSIQLQEMEYRLPGDYNGNNRGVSATAALIDIGNNVGKQTTDIIPTIFGIPEAPK